MNKIRFFNPHHEIDGVIIFFTGKASGKIGRRIHAGVKFPADRAAKSKAALTHFGRDAQLLYQGLYRDMIAQDKQFIAGVLRFYHLIFYTGPSFGRRLTQFLMLMTWLVSVSRSINAAVS